MLMKSLSLRQPWAYAVLYLNKRFENRDWKPTNSARKFRGTFLLHASKSHTGKDRDEYDHMTWMCGHKPGLVTRKQCLAIPAFDNLERGGIVGIADVIGSVTDHEMNQRAKSPANEWYFGPFALVLDNVRPLPFTPCNGMLGFVGMDTTALGLDAAILATNPQLAPQPAMAQ